MPRERPSAQQGSESAKPMQGPPGPGILRACQSYLYGPGQHSRASRAAAQQHTLHDAAAGAAHGRRLRRWRVGARSAYPAGGRADGARFIRARAQPPCDGWSSCAEGGEGLADVVGPEHLGRAGPAQAPQNSLVASRHAGMRGGREKGAGEEEQARACGRVRGEGGEGRGGEGKYIFSVAALYKSNSSAPFDRCNVFVGCQIL
jgi:hypothetical protein